MAAQLLHHFTHSAKLPPHSYTVLPPLTAQLLHHFTALNKLPPHSYIIIPPWQPNSYIILPPLNNLPPSLLQQFNPPSPWQPNSYIILSPLYKLPLHSYTILTHPSPLAAQLWSHFTHSEQITHSLLHQFPPWQPNSNSYIILSPLNKLPPQSDTILNPLVDQLLHRFTPSEQITPSTLHHFTPLGSPTQTLTSFYPLWTNYPLSLTPF